MDFTMKDFIQAAVYIASAAAMVTKILDRVKGLEDKINTMSKVLFKERGGLNVITEDECDSYRADNREGLKEALAQLRVQEQNIIKIMLAMNLEPASSDVWPTQRR